MYNYLIVNLLITFAYGSSYSWVRSWGENAVEELSRTNKSTLKKKNPQSQLSGLGFPTFFLVANIYRGYEFPVLKETLNYAANQYKEKGKT